jgi:ribosomal protein S18 acetylase RimI-like enzyme
VALGDTASVRECVGAVALERRFLAFTKPFSFVETAFYIARVVDAGHPYFVAIEGTHVIGWCDVTPSRGDVHAHVGVLGMGVLKDWRGRGIGRRLIERTVDAARVHFEQVDLHVYASNAPARALYASIGFIEQGRKRNGRKLDGVYDDDIVMTRFLVEPS